MRRVGIAAALLVVLLAGCSAEGASTDAAVEAEQPRDVGGGAVALGGGADTDAAADEQGGTAAAPAPAAPGDDGGDQVPQLPPEAAPDLAVGDRVIKEGTVTVEVEAGSFDEAYAEIVEAARRVGGTVVASTTRSTSADGGTSGSVSVRVPVESYEDLLVGVGRVGRVRSREVTAQDVSTEFVDLQSRQRNLEAQERFYLGLLEEAAGVQDAIAVQQQLNGITEQLEQVKGRIAYLDERTTYSTLTVQLVEPGGPLLLADEPDAGPSIARYWETARRAFVNVVGSVLVAVGFLAPLLLIGLVAAVAVRLLTRRPGAPAPRPRPAPPRAEPEPERETEPVG